MDREREEMSRRESTQLESHIHVSLQATGSDDNPTGAPEGRSKHEGICPGDLPDKRAMVEAKDGMLYENDVDKDPGPTQSATVRVQERRRQRDEGLALFADCETSRTKNRRNFCAGQAP